MIGWFEVCLVGLVCKLGGGLVCNMGGWWFGSSTWLLGVRLSVMLVDGSVVEKVGKEI